MNDYNVAVDNSGTLDEYMEQNDVNGIPHCFLFNAKGELTWQGHPMSCEDELAQFSQLSKTNN